jgi:gamma-butyrobetaine dioxygenase
VAGSDGRRSGTVRPELKELVGDLGIVPARAQAGAARAVLERDGAVIIPDSGDDPEELVVAAARLLGGRLREVFGIRAQHGVDAPRLGIHSDGANVVVDVHGQRVRLRDPDEDYLLMLCTQPARDGGDSVLLDGYALVEALRTARPELHAFLTGCDVDYFGSWVDPARGVPHTPLVRRMVEHTRGGRRAVRASDYAAPVPREPRWDEHLAFLEEYADVLATAQDCAAAFRMDAGDLLVLDNYRYLHGRDAYRGERKLHVLTVRTTEAF